MNPRWGEHAVDGLFVAFIVGIVALIAFGIVAASLSHTNPTVCPPGWKPNTGYLQQVGSCVRK